MDGDLALLSWLQELNAGVARHAWADMPSVVARVLLSGGSRLLFVLNTTAEPRVGDGDAARRERQAGRARPH